MFVIERKPKLKEEKEMAYWRKANQIHNWIITNVAGGVDNGSDVPLTKDHIKELLKICTIVQRNKDLAPTLLPTTEGFFFGSTEYDDWYFEQIEDTINQLNIILATHNFNDSSLIYYASW